MDDTTRKTAIGHLTTVIHASSPFLTTFLLIHLSAPVLANVGGSSLASQVMLLGREYYQTSFGEKYLLLAPLGLHVSSAIAKRLLSTPPTNSPRPVSSVLTLTGLGAVLFSSVHFLTHRVFPSEPTAPIHAVGPAELDWEFVKVGLHNWPWQSILLYGGLVGCVLLHSAEGMNIIASTWGFPRYLRSSKKTRKIAAVVGAVPILSGLWFVWKEPLMTFSSLARRFEAVFTCMPIYRL